MSDALRVGLIGTGGISRYAHIAAWRQVPDTDIVAVAEPMEDRRTDALRLLGDPQGRRIQAFADYEQMLTASRPDLVDVTIQAGPLKNRAISAALAAGCHVTCQKPFTLEEASARRLAAEARSTGRLLSVNQQARFAGAFAIARQWIEAGRLGELRTIRLWSDFPNAGERQWLDYSVHSFDLIRFWAGREPLRLRAWWKRQTPLDQHVLAVWLEFEGGLMAEIWDEMSSSTTLRWGFRIMGSEGSARGHEAFESTMLPAEVAFAASGQRAETVEPGGPQYVPSAFTRYFAAVVSAIRSGTACPSPAEDNLKTLRLAFAARQAADLGDWVTVVE